jgi:glutathione S-transferase
MDHVIVYGFQRSTFVNVARLVLCAKGVSFTFHDTEMEMYSPEHLKRHPWNRVPVLQHGDFWLYETSAIVQYVDEAFAGPGLQPTDPRDRAKMHQWISNLNSYYYPYFIYRLTHETLVFPELGIAPDLAVVNEALPKVELGLTVLERELSDGRPFIVNGSPTLADYFMLPTFTALTFAPAGPGLLAKFPLVSQWFKRMIELPVVAKFRESLPPRAPIPHARRWAVDHRAKAN